MAERSAARLRAVVAALRKRTVANGCTPAEAAAAAAKAAQLEAILAAGEGRAARGSPVPPARPSAPVNNPWASSPAAQTATASPFIFEGLHELFSRPATASAVTARQSPPLGVATAYAPGRMPYAFAVSREGIDVFETDEWTLVEALVLAYRQMGPNISTVNTPGPLLAQIEAMIPALLDGDELRDRQGNLLETISLNERTYTKAKPYLSPSGFRIFASWEGAK